MTIAPISRTQRLTLEFIVDYIERHGWPPSFDDISREFGRISSNAIFERLEMLEKKGFITRRKRVARAITVTPLGLAKTGRQGPLQYRTGFVRTYPSQSGQQPVPVAASAQKENEP